MRRKTLCFMLLLILALLSACAGAPETPAAENTPAPTATPEPTPEAEQQLIDMFGPRCITEYTQQLTLDGFDGEVWFVPYRPFNRCVYAKLIQNGETLAQLNCNGHEGCGGEEFAGLDSVAFRDLNGDGKTDIVMIERFGDERFASLFFSADMDTDAPDERFYRAYLIEWELENRAALCSVPLTAEWAADMVRVDDDGSLKVRSWTGDFDDWRAAYRAAAERFARECQHESLMAEPLYALIDVDGDDVPELAACADNYISHISIYTFRDGALYNPVQWWECGYFPGGNSVMHFMRDISSFVDFFVEIGPDGEGHRNAELRMNFFADTNDNGVFDDPLEYDYIDKNSNGEYDEGDELRYTYWWNGEKISREEYEGRGEGYERIEPSLSFDELMALLDEYQ